jgi:carotenoid isomerooxygenase
MQRKDGQLFKTFLAEAFFYLHIINSYEEDSHLIVDICCYKDPTMLDCMYVDALMVIAYFKTRTLFCI